MAKDISLNKENHKRYLCFGYDDYYPFGGFNDFIDSFDTLSQCVDCIKQSDYENHQVYDRIDGKQMQIDDFKEYDILLVDRWRDIRY